MPRQTGRRVSIPDRFLTQLKADLIFRRIESGIRSLQANRYLFRNCRPGEKNAAIFLGYLAAWVDVGFGKPSLIEELLVPFDKAARGALSLTNYLPLRLAEGFSAMSQGRHDEAIRHFETVLALEAESEDKQLIIIANFWIARCKRIQGRYADALEYVEAAKSSAAQMGWGNMHAVIQVLEAWCTFQQGRPAEARNILAQAELVLAKTDDYVTRGNVNSVYGRIARDEGNYNQALHRFESAIEEYKKRDAQHRNLARTLVNIALVERLLGVQVREMTETRPASRGARTRRNGRKTFGHKAEPERYYREALKHLAEAREIYSQHNEHRGLGNIHVARAYVYIDKDDLVRAGVEGSAAYQIGCEKDDFVLKARARILQSTVELESAGDHTRTNAKNTKFSQLALELAREALEYAKETENRLLIAHAYIRLGLALSSDLSAAREEAQQYCDEATALLKPKTDSYVWRELRALKQKLSVSGSVDSRLREWSHGAVGNKTFQQITEEFAAMVIPKVWATEGRKISRVVARLSISPKKVRKILRTQGFTPGNR